MIVRVEWLLHRVLDQLLECRALADELDQLGDATATAEHDELFFLEQEFFDGTTFLLVQELVDFDVTSIVIRPHVNIIF